MPVWFIAPLDRAGRGHLDARELTIFSHMRVSVFLVVLFIHLFILVLRTVRTTINILKLKRSQYRLSLGLSVRIYANSACMRVVKASKRLKILCKPDLKCLAGGI